MNHSKPQKIQDEHLDLMLRLAYRRAAGREIRQLISEIPAPFTQEEEKQAQADYALFMEKLALQERPPQSKQKRRRFSYFIEISACIVLLLFISLSAASAKVDFFRSKVLELFIEFNDDHAAIHMDPVENAEFEVPTGYQGEFYPTYIPEGFELNWLSPINPQVQYSNEAMDHLLFIEIIEEGDSISVTAENALYYTVFFNGTEAKIIQEPAQNQPDGSFSKHSYTIYWMIDNRMIVIMYNGELEELLSIAASVRRIVKL